MKRRRFFFFFLKSISQRKGRILIASASVTLAVAVVTGMFGVTVGIREKLGTELKAYGANVVISPQRGDYLQYEMVKAVSGIKDVDEASGQVFGRANAGNQVVELIGLDISSIKGRGWRFEGQWPARPHEVLAGTNIRDSLKLAKGQRLELVQGTNRAEYTVSGFFEKGGSEDSAVIMAIPDIWELTGLEGQLSAILVRGRSGRLEEIVSGIKGIIPDAAVKTLRQVALAEESLLAKIQLLMALVTVVVLFASAISVASTMGANVLERREEIGLMKAIGATWAEITLFYKAEAVLIGLSGGMAGFVFGWLSAQAVSKGAFNSFISMPFYISFLSLASGLFIAMASSYFPVRDAMKYNPAVILRGE
ncbi:MAG: ABC transporter permease [Nitrospirae bacterium]|nr:ABC transporter permease [Nitrospirota bacterium]